MRIEEAIKQEKFDRETGKLAVNLLYTSSWFNCELKHALDEHGISWQQFNLMRILRGQKGEPASQKLIAERMIDRMSNTSRLIDKLVRKGLVTRTTCPSDRRQVDVFLTEEGGHLLERASKSVEAMNERLMAHMSQTEMQSMNAMLDKLRNPLLNQ